jgi:protein SCO1/2
MKYWQMRLDNSPGVNRPGKPIITALLKVFITLLLGFALLTGVRAHDLEPIDLHAQHKQIAAVESNMAMARIELPDGMSMLNQYGDKVDLRKDVIGDKIVAINFVYTTCTTVCPVVSSIFTMVQKNFGELMGKDVVLITITVDPTRDTPHRLLKYSKNFNPGAGWSWLTGDKKTVDKTLSALGAYTPNFEDHPAMVLIGDDSNSQWYRYYGFPAPEVIETRVRDLLSNRSS